MSTSTVSCPTMPAFWASSGTSIVGLALILAATGGSVQGGPLASSSVIVSGPAFAIVVVPARTSNDVPLPGANELALRPCANRIGARGGGGASSGGGTASAFSIGFGFGFFGSGLRGRGV